MIQFLENLKAFPAVNFYFLGTSMGGLITSRGKEREEFFLLFWQIKKRASWQQSTMTFFGRNSFQKVLQQSRTISKCYFTSSHVTLETLKMSGTWCRLNQLLQNIRFVSVENGLTYNSVFPSLITHACKQVFIFVQLHWHLGFFGNCLRFQLHIYLITNQTTHVSTLLLRISRLL